MRCSAGPSIVSCAWLTLVTAYMASGLACAADSGSPSEQRATKDEAFALSLCQVAVPDVCLDKGEHGQALGASAQIVKDDVESLGACRVLAERLQKDCAVSTAQLRYRYTDRSQVADGRVGLGAPIRLASSGFKGPLRYSGGLPIERDQMGYAPNYVPGPVSQAPNGDLIVRWADVLQRRSEGGAWLVTDLAGLAKAAIEQLPGVAEFKWDWNQGISYSDLRVASDTKGVMYTLAQGVNWRAKVDGPWTVGLFLLSSADGGKQWTARQVPLPDGKARWRARIESNNGYNEIDGPPTLLIYDNDYRDQRNASLYVYLRLKGSGSVRDRLVRIAEDSLLQDNHSGAANSTVTTGSHIYAAYPRNYGDADKPGTPAVMVVVDRATGEKVAEEVIGYGGVAANVDNHNVPGLCLGRDDMLQVLMPGHHEDLLFRRGRLAGRDILWQAAERIGEPAVKGGGYTYGSLDCARDGRTVITTRWAGNQYQFQLVLLQADASGVWATWERGRHHQVLVSPGRSFYGAWRQKVSLDRKGRIYLYYSTNLNQLTDREYADLLQAFPFEAWDRTAFQTPAFCVKGAEPRCWRHPMPDVAPVVIYSDDFRNWTFLE